MEPSIKSIVRTYALHHYGNLISVDDPKFDPEQKAWIAELKSDYPRIIHDDRCPDERTLRFLTLRKLGTIKVGESLEPNSIDATSRDACVNNLSYFLNLWQDRVEKIIVKASSDNLANTNAAKTFLGKIETIIARLEWNDMILDSEIDFLTGKERERVRKYLQLLEGLDIVVHNDNGYSYGNMFTELSHSIHNSSELSTAILSFIIKNRYAALKEAFNISQLETVVHVDSLYYRPALEANEIIYWKKESFERSCALIYGYKSKIYFRMPYVLKELVQVQALKFEDNCYFGNERLFNKMIEAKDQITLCLPTA
jgi:hypothetical protein